MSQQAINRIIDSIDDCPEDWSGTGYRFTHTSGMSFWVANGWMMLHADETSVPFSCGPITRWRIYRAYKRWQQAMVLDKIVLDKAPPANGTGD